MRWLLLCLVSLSWGKLCPVDQEPKRVLFLLAYHVGQRMEDGFVSGLRQSLDSVDIWTEVHYEYMDAKRFAPPMLDSLIDESLRRKYGNSCLHAVLAADNIAFDYARRHRADLFEDVPIVFMGVNNYHDSLVEGYSGITGLVEDNDLPGTLDLIHALQPDIRTLYFVYDQTETGKRMRAVAENHLRHDKRWEARWLFDETYASLADSLSVQREHTAAVILTWSVDREGKLYSEKRMFGIMGKRAGIPVYVMLENHFVPGFMGGALLSGAQHGRIAAGMLVKILQGTPADSIPILKRSPKVDSVDFRTLLRFGISPDAVPAGARVGHQPFSVWMQYRSPIVLTLLFILSLLVCIGVLLRMRFQLRSSRQHYRELVEHASTAILRWSSKGEILYLNEYAESLFGWKLSEVQGKHVVGILLPAQGEDGRDLRGMIDALLSSPEGYGENENENVTRDGRRLWIRWQNRADYDSDGNLQSILSVGTDLTEKRLREEEVSRFNRKVAHDLKSPLITISSFAEMVREDLQENDVVSARNDLEYIRHAAGKMARLLDELSKLSALGRSESEKSRFLAEDAVEEARKLVAGRLSEEKVEVYIDAKAWLEGDRNRFVEVFQNLLDNAAKHMGAQAHPQIAVGLEKRDGKSLLYVRDNGEGIPPEHLEDIFDIFVKLNPESDGSGMGLAFVRRIVDSQGGRIWAESQGLGHGSAFYMLLDNLEEV